MRTALIFAALAAAAPAAAQPLSAGVQLDALRMEQDAIQRRMIDQQNQLMATEARARADQAAAQLQIQRDLPVRPPELRYDPAVRAAPAPTSTPTYPSMPGGALAESNRRVQDAARNRR